MRNRRPLTRRPLVIGALGLSAVLAATAMASASASAHGRRSEVSFAPESVTGTATVTGTEVPATDGPTELLAALEDDLGDRTSGAYLDAAGRPVVTVTDDVTADVVKKAGAVVRRVTRTRAELRSAMSTLNSDVHVAGTSWAVHPATNQVVISYDSSVTAADLATLEAAAAELGDVVRMEPMDGVLSTTISGGNAIFGQGARCSLGFAVTVQGADAFLTAGHCGNAIRTWFADPGGEEELGTTISSSFPENDFALVQVTSGQVPVEGTVGRRDITSAATPVVGQRVVRRGSTTGTRDGRVISLNSTVNFPEGTVTGLIGTTVCAEPGDSGGPLFARDTALGLTSGGSGDCQRGGITFFQPVEEVLQAFDATLR